ncbi:hypothetical protein ACQ4PT_027549 [Festuca glaucescens]
MGICHGKNATGSPCCPDLPPEIAGEILSRLLSQEDRLSFKAVCRGWRLAARQQGPRLPPAMPCINLGHGAYLNFADDDGSKVRHRPFSTPKGLGFRAGVAFGGWVMNEHKRSRRCFLSNPFSPSTPSIEVPCRYDRSRAGGVFGTSDPRTGLLDKIPVNKIIVCSPRLIIARPGTTAVLRTVRRKTESDRERSK